MTLLFKYINFKKLHFITLVTFFLFLYACQTDIKNKEQKIAFLSKIAKPIKTLNPSNTSFEDLKFFKKTLEKTNIVMLGEIAHTDGSSLEAKTRLVKFLHQEMNFEVLAFESDLLGCNYAWETLKKTDNNYDSAFAKGVYPVWSKSFYLKELIKYIGQSTNTNKPLELAGIDIQPNTGLQASERIGLYKSHIKSIEPNISLNKFDTFFKIFNSTKKYIINSQKVDSTIQKKVFNELKLLETVFTKADTSIIKNKLYLHHIKNLQRYFYFAWNIDFNNINPDIANIRDLEMGNNVIWLKEHMYPNKKIIIWGANSHLIYNRNLLYYPDKMIPLGDFVKRKYGAKCFVIGFTCFSGKLGSVLKNYTQDVPMASNKSIEQLIHNTGHKYAFFSSKKLKSSTLFNDSYVARFLGFSNRKAKWNSMLDGFIFIDKMKANKKNTNE